MSKTVGERLVKIETDLDYLKSQADTTVQKLDAFIEAADAKYATKDELGGLKELVQENRATIRYLIEKWGPIVILAGWVLFNVVVGG